MPEILEKIKKLSRKKNPSPKGGEWNGEGRGKSLASDTGNLLVRLEGCNRARLSPHYHDARLQLPAFSFSANLRHVSSSVSGLSDMVWMPVCTSHCAKSK